MRLARGMRLARAGNSVSRKDGMAMKTKQRILRAFGALALGLLAPVGLAACDDGAEDAGEEIDEAMDDVGDELEDIGDDVGK
jgi:hypothetical protein